MRSIGMVEPQGTSAGRLLVIVNPFSGRRNSRKALDAVQPLFAGASIHCDVSVCGSAEDAQDIVRAADLSAYFGLCVAGGDGTAHAVVNALMSRADGKSVPLGFLPTGSGNTIHQHLGCRNAFEAVRQILKRQTRPLDVLEVNLDGEKCYGLAIVGWGAISDINTLAEKMRFLGRHRYAAAALLTIARARPRGAVIKSEGQICEGRRLFAAACNTKFAAEGMQLAPKSEIDDGKVDLVILRAASRRQMLELFRKVYTGAHLQLPCLDYQQTSYFSIDSQQPESIDLDGEIKQCRKLTVRVIASALRVFHDPPS